MKVNDLIEFLEYSAPRATVCVAVVDANGRIVRHDAPKFLSHEGRVYLVIDQRPESGGSVGEPAGEIVLEDYESSQVFGNHFLLLPKSEQPRFVP